MDIFLFVPYGALLRSLRVKNPLFVALLTSVLIELAQYIFKLGLCETDDVINNKRFNYTVMFTVETNLFMWYNLMGMPVIFFIYKKRERKPEK